MRGVFTFIGVVTLFIIATWVFMTLIFISDEDRISRLIQKCVKGFESGSVFSIAGELSPDYSDSSGADKSVVISALQSLFDTTVSRSFSVSSIEIQIKENAAQVQIHGLLNFQTAPGSVMVVPRTGEINSKRLQIQLELLKIKKRWKVIHTNWKRIT